jgi:TnpA family transposase
VSAGHALRPSHRARHGWDECQRIFVSLALKATTQSIIVRKLCAHARNNRTKRAPWEYDSIHRSLYLLNYIDSPSLRQNVQKAVNRGENYHQLRRAVSFASFGKLRFKTAAGRGCSSLREEFAMSSALVRAAVLSWVFFPRKRRGVRPGRTPPPLPEEKREAGKAGRNLETHHERV